MHMASELATAIINVEGIKAARGESPVWWPTLFRKKNMMVHGSYSSYMVLKSGTA